MVRAISILRRLRRCNNGAASIEFVLLTAGLVMIGIGVGVPFRDGVRGYLVAINDLLLEHPKQP